MRGKGYGLARVYNCNLKKAYIKNHFWWEENDENCLIYRQFSKYYLSIGKLKDALESQKKVFELNQEDSVLLKSRDSFLMGQIYNSLRNFEKAIEFFHKSISYIPLHWEAHFEIMRMYYRRHNPPEHNYLDVAIHYLNISNEINSFQDDKNLKKKRNFIYYDWLALLMSKKGEKEKAIKAAEKALKLFPEETRLQNFINKL